MSEPLQLVDWDLAVSAGTRMVRPGPQIARHEARQAVLDLRRYAVEARGHVREYTGLDAPAKDAPVAVVDRTAWLRANAAGFQVLIDPVAERLSKRRTNSAGATLVTSVGSRLTGLEVGVLLAWLSGKVLGQYELLPTEAERPRLLLVAPNVVEAERAMHVKPDDFRLWVCLHEETHRVQFGAVGWLRDHLVREVSNLLETFDPEPSEVLSRLREAVGSAAAAARTGTGGRSLLELIQTPEQRAKVDQLTAVMSLLEGHADFVMDGVGPDVVPTVAEIREAFQARRTQVGPVDGALRRLLGLDAKLRQYRDGAAFVRHVVSAVGMSGFNRVWESAENLPKPAEIANPALWVARVAT